MEQGRSVKRGLTIGLAIAMAGITYSYVSARSLRSEPASYVDPHAFDREPANVALRPPSEIVDTVREMGLAPTSEVSRRGPYYVLHALDTDGVELRVVADAYFGDILSVQPAQPYSLAPDYVRAPRIIHVPQPGDEEIKGKNKGRSDRNGAASKRQGAVKNAPPSDALLTPIRPTPKFGTTSKAAEKSGSPRAVPPSGSTPPKTAPGGG